MAKHFGRHHTYIGACKDQANVETAQVVKQGHADGFLSRALSRRDAKTRVQIQKDGHQDRTSPEHYRFSCAPFHVPLSLPRLNAVLSLAYLVPPTWMLELQKNLRFCNVQAWCVPIGANVPDKLHHCLRYFRLTATCFRKEFPRNCATLSATDTVIGGRSSCCSTYTTFTSTKHC